MIDLALLLPTLNLPTMSAVNSVLAAWLFVPAIAILVLKPRDILARRVAYLIFVAAVAAQVSGLIPVGGLPARLAYLGALGLLPTAFLAFCYRLIETFGPDEEPAAALRTRLFQLASRAALVTAALDIGCRIIYPTLSGVSNGVLFATQSAAYAIGFDFVIRHCVRTRGSRSYNALIVIVTGALVAYLPALFLKFLPQTFGQPQLLPYVFFTAFQLALPLAYGFASIRWRAGSIVALVDRVSVYIILALGLVLAYLGVAFVFERSVDATDGLLPQFVSLAFTATVAITYAPLRARLQRFLDKRLFRDHYNYGQTLQRFSSDFATLLTQDDVIARMLDGLTQTLNTDGIAYVALPESVDERIFAFLEDDDLHAQGGFDTPEGRASVLRGLASIGADARLRPDAPLLADPWPGCLALVLISSPISGEGVGLLVLGNKRTSAGLRKADRMLLITLAHQVGTALANAVLVEGLRTSLRQVQISTNQLASARAEQQLLLRELVNAEERQRASLARELHDDGLQEVLYLARHARLAQQLAERLEGAHAEGAFAATAVEGGEHDLARTERADALVARLRLELGYLVERSAVAEHALRALCLGLYPALLSALGLAGALDDLALDLSAATEMAVHVSYDDATAEAAKTLSPEVALHAYRIVQEAIHNAAKHAESAEVEVTLRYGPRHEGSGRASDAGRELRVVVQDHGPGLPMPINFGDLLRHGHLGLAGMRERAGRAGGEIIFDIGPDGGTRITLHVPIEERVSPRLIVETSARGVKP